MDKINDRTQASISEPDGAPTSLSESLIGFLAHREENRGFRLGDWIEALEDASLRELKNLADQAYFDLGSSGAALDDLLTVVYRAVAAEAGSDSPALTYGQMVDGFAVVFLSAGLESLRRQGLLTIERPPSILPGGVFAYTLGERAPGTLDELLAGMRHDYL